MALPFDLGRHELVIRGDLPQEPIDALVATLVVPLRALRNRAGLSHPPTAG